MKRSFALASVLVLSLQSVAVYGFNWDDVDVSKAVSGGAKLVKAATGLSDSDEMNLGREVASNLVARYSLISDTRKLTYINLVGRTLVRHANRPGIVYHFGILSTSEINAFATPGGYIFVTEGLLNLIKDESELAGVIAHEISHVTERHIAKALQKANLIGAGEDFAAASGKGSSPYGALADYSLQILSKGYSRSEELDADRLGTALVSSAGYEMTGLRRVVERLGAQDPKSFLQTRFNKTHPAAKDRLARLDRWIERHPSKSKGQRLPFRFQKSWPVLTPH